MQEYSVLETRWLFALFFLLMVNFCCVQLEDLVLLAKLLRCQKKRERFPIIKDFHLMLLMKALDYEGALLYISSLIIQSRSEQFRNCLKILFNWKKEKRREKLILIKTKEGEKWTNNGGHREFVLYYPCMFVPLPKWCALNVCGNKTWYML